MNHNGTLTDDERDADGDGLSNWDESHGRMTADWWKIKYDGTNDVLETPHTVTFGPVSMLDPDSDGDGLVDGADDTDFDGLTNAFEVERPGGWQGDLRLRGPAAAPPQLQPGHQPATRTSRILTPTPASATRAPSRSTRASRSGRASATSIPRSAITARMRTGCGPGWDQPVPAPGRASRRLLGRSRPGHDPLPNTVRGVPCRNPAGAAGRP